MPHEQVFENTGFLKNASEYTCDDIFIVAVLPGAQFILASAGHSFLNFQSTDQLTGSEIKSLLSHIFNSEKVEKFCLYLIECVTHNKTIFIAPGTLADDVYITLMPASKDGNVVTHIICTVQNEIKQAAYYKTFVEQKLFMQKLYDVFPAPFYITDDKDVVIEYNDAAKRNIGISREKLLDVSITHFVEEIELLNADYSIMQPEQLGASTAFEQKTVVEDMVTGLRVKGQKPIEWYRTFAAYLNLPGYGIVGYNESITKQKNQEEHILSIKNILNAIISSSTDNIMFVDINNKVSLFNEAAFHHFSKINQRPVYIGEDVINIIPVDRQEIFKETLENLKEKRQVVREHKVIYPDGSEVWFYRKFYTVYDEQNQYMGYVIYSGDISRQKEFELTLSRQNEQLKEIAKIQTEELVKPLATVLGLIRILTAKSNLDKQLLAGLKESALQLETLIKSKTYMAENLA